MMRKSSTADFQMVRHCASHCRQWYSVKTKYRFPLPPSSIHHYVTVYLVSPTATRFPDQWGSSCVFRGILCRNSTAASKAPQVFSAIIASVGPCTNKRWLSSYFSWFCWVRYSSVDSVSSAPKCCFCISPSFLCNELETWNFWSSCVVRNTHKYAMILPKAVDLRLILAISLNCQPTLRIA